MVNFLLFFAVVGGVASQALAEEGPLSLKAAVQLSLENSPDYDSARKTQILREQEYRKTFTNLLPSVDASATGGLQNSFALAGNGGTVFENNPAAPWYSALSLGINETLYDNGVTLTNIKIADLNRQIAKLEMLKARDQLVLNIANEYYRHSLLAVLVTVRAEQLRLLSKQFSTVQNQYQQGLKTRSDYLRLKTQVQRAEIARFNAETDQSESKINLKRLLGLRLSENAYDFALIDLKTKADLKKLPKLPPLLEKTYDYKLKTIKQELRQKTVSLKERNLWPTLGASSSIVYNNQNFINAGRGFNDGNQLSWNVLLTTTFNLWDWGARKNDIEIAKVTQDIELNKTEQALVDLRADIDLLTLTVDKSRKNYVLSQDLLDVEEQSSRDLEIQYREGKVAYLDLVTELNNRLDARVQYYTSYVELLKAHAKHRFFEGQIYEMVMEE